MSQTQVAIAQNQAPVAAQAAEAAKAKAIEYLSSMGLSLPQGQKEQFIELCSALELNPFRREIYAVGYGSKFNIILGYEVYLKKADMLGKCQGWSVRTEGEGDNLKAVIEIHRRDYTIPFVHEVELSEYRQDTQIWRSKPKTMLKKVAMAQGFRLAFPSDFGGLPYIAEEFDPSTASDANTPATATVQTTAPKQLSKLQEALTPFGISLKLQGNVAVATGQAVFNNNSLLKQMGFVYDKNARAWQISPVIDDSEVIEGIVEEAAPAQQEVAPSQAPAESAPAESQMGLKTLADFSSLKELENYLESLGLKVSEVKANSKGTSFAKIEGAIEKAEGELIALGGKKNGDFWVINVSTLLPADDEEDLDALF